MVSYLGIERYHYSGQSSILNSDLSWRGHAGVSPMSSPTLFSFIKVLGWGICDEFGLNA